MRITSRHKRYLVHKTIDCTDSVTVFDNATGFSMELNHRHFVDHLCPEYMIAFMDKLPAYVWTEAQTILDNLRAQGARC